MSGYRMHFTQPGRPFLKPQKEWRKSWTAESRTTWKERTKIQIKLDTTCNKNEQQVPKIMQNCKSYGRRRLGRPLKWILDETETGLSRCKSSRMMMMMMMMNVSGTERLLNPLKPELNPICYLLALLGAHHFLHVKRIRVKLLTFRLLMSYIYGAPILDVSRSHTTTQHSR